MEIIIESTIYFNFFLSPIIVHGYFSWPSRKYDRINCYNTISTETKNCMYLPPVIKHLQPCRFSQVDYYLWGSFLFFHIFSTDIHFIYYSYSYMSSCVFINLLKFTLLNFASMDEWKVNIWKSSFQKLVILPVASVSDSLNETWPDLGYLNNWLGSEEIFEIKIVYFFRKIQSGFCSILIAF